jgi:hypothetical protein
MGKIRRGNHLFVTWIGDHGHHVHIFKDGRLVAKWDLTEGRVLEGRINSRIRARIRELRREGKL